LMCSATSGAGQPRAGLASQDLIKAGSVSE
jgi:hypothetical protein